MKNFIYGIVILSSIFFVGCATQNVSKVSAPVGASVGVHMEADIKVGEKISGTSSATIIMGMFTVGADSKFADGVTYGASPTGFAGLFPNPVNDIKAAAAYKALASANAEVIVAPRYVIDIKDFKIFKKITVTVTGYKGTIKNIK